MEGWGNIWGDVEERGSGGREGGWVVLRLAMDGGNCYVTKQLR